MDKEDYLETEDIEIKLHELQEVHKDICVQFEDVKNTIEDINRQQQNNQSLYNRVIERLRNFSNLMTEPCLIQVIAILFCIVVILIIKL
jgi:uncharacterized membrane protein